MKRNIILIIVSILLVGIFLFGYTYLFGTPSEGVYENGFQIQRMAYKIDNALEKGDKLDEGLIETEILKGSYAMDNAANKMVARFAPDDNYKDETTLKFNITYYYDQYTEDMDTSSKHHGLYVNLYYPTPETNSMNTNAVESVEVEKIKEGTRYTVTYKDYHFSRRMEWEYCQMINDYEVFIIDKNGVITRYESVAYYKTQGGVDGKTGITVKLSDYKL